MILAAVEVKLGEDVRGCMSLFVLIKEWTVRDNESEAFLGN